MDVPSGLVEYVIIGAVALIWLVPVLQAMGVTVPQDSAAIALFAPGLYVLGMFVDFLGYNLVHGRKQQIKAKVYGALETSDSSEATHDDKSDQSPEMHNTEQAPSSAKVVDTSSSGKPIVTHEQDVEVWIAQQAPEVAKEIETRSSRDRIARGALANVIVSTLVLSIASLRGAIPVSPILIIVIGIVLIIVSWLMWERFQRLSYSFELASIRQLEGSLVLKRKVNSV
jgi:hypothetical protein